MRHKFFRGFRNIIDADFSFQIRFIPDKDLRRYKTDIADFNHMLFAVAIFNRGINDNIRGKQILTGFLINNIGIHIRKIRTGNGFFQIIQAKVKFMVTEVSDGITHSIHQFMCRMGFTVI